MTKQNVSTEKNDGWKKLGGDKPPFFNFVDPGDSVEGTLIKVNSGVQYKNYSNTVNEYIVEDDNGLHTIVGCGSLD